MKKYLSIYLILLIVASCVPGSEQIDRNKEIDNLFSLLDKLKFYYIRFSESHC